jgi:hypothetical protein
MRARSKAPILNRRSFNRSSFEWQGGALIRCIGGPASCGRKIPYWVSQQKIIDVAQRRPHRPSDAALNVVGDRSWQSWPLGRRPVILVPIELPEVVQSHQLHVPIEHGYVHRSRQRLIGRPAGWHRAWPSPVARNGDNPHQGAVPRIQNQIGRWEIGCERRGPWE